MSEKRDKLRRKKAEPLINKIMELAKRNEIDERTERLYRAVFASEIVKLMRQDK